MDTTEVFYDTFGKRDFYSFDSWEEFEGKLNAFQERTCTVFRIGSSNHVANERKRRGIIIDDKMKYTCVTILCIHYGHTKANPNATGKRPNQRYLQMGCEAIFSLAYQTALCKLCMTKMNLVHNHTLPPEFYHAKMQVICAKKQRAQLADLASGEGTSKQQYTKRKSIHDLGVMPELLQMPEDAVNTVIFPVFQLRKVKNDLKALVPDLSQEHSDIEIPNIGSSAVVSSAEAVSIISEDGKRLTYFHHPHSVSEQSDSAITHALEVQEGEALILETTSSDFDIDGTEQIYHEYKIIHTDGSPEDSDNCSTELRCYEIPVEAESSVFSVRNLSNGAANENVYELRTYCFHPKEVKNFLSLTEKKIGLRFGHSKCVGYWTSEIGGMNEVVHIWEYESLSHRANVRNALASDPTWISDYFSLILPMMSKQVNTAMALLPWSKLETQENPGGVYELESIQVSGASDPGMLERYSSAIAHRYNAKLLGAFSNIIGPLNTVNLLWHHKSIDDLTATRQKSPIELKDTVDNLYRNVHSIATKMLLPCKWSDMK